MPFLRICTLLALLLSPCTTHALAPVVVFTYQSQHIQAESWFQIFTLCLTPLIGHLVAGVRSPTVIPSHSKSPSWSAFIPHFNPISVIWRWYAITDRRLRACDWDRADMAACNAIFWDSKKARWDGSEDIMLRSRAWIIKLPEKKHAAILSASSFTTFVLAFQGVQAAFNVYRGFDSTFTPASLVQGGLPNTFVPIAIMSLFRLPAALWLSDDYVYWDFTHQGNSDQIIAETPSRTTERTDDSKVKLDPRTSEQAPMIPLQLSEPNDKPRVHSTRTRIALAYRIWWLVSMNGLLVPAVVNLGILLFSAPRSFPYISLNFLLFLILYFILAVSAILITTTYILLGRTNTTTIPCIHAVWYKVLTMLLAAMGLATMIVAGLEIRQSQNGIVTSLPEFECNGSTGLCIPVPRGGHGNFNI